MILNKLTFACNGISKQLRSVLISSNQRLVACSKVYIPLIFTMKYDYNTNIITLNHMAQVDCQAVPGKMSLFIIQQKSI